MCVKGVFHDGFDMSLSRLARNFVLLGSSLSVDLSVFIFLSAPCGLSHKVCLPSCLDCNGTRKGLVFSSSPGLEERGTPACQPVAVSKCLQLPWESVAGQSADADSV